MDRTIAQEPCRSTFADHVRFLKRSRQHHEGQHRLIDRLHFDDVAAEIGKILRRRRFQLADGLTLSVVYPVIIW